MKSINWKFWTFTLIAQLLLLSGLWAQNPVVVSANLSAHNITVGDSVFLRIQVHGSSGTKVSPISLQPLEQLSDLEVLDPGSLDTLSHAGTLVHEQLIKLTAWDSGYYQVPAIDITYFDANGLQGQVRSKPIDLQVRLFQEESEAIRPINPIIEEPLTLEDALPYLVGLVVILSLIGLVWYVRRRSRLKREVEPAPPLLPPHELALQRIRALEARQLWQKGELKTYYSELSYLFRAYLEGRFEFPALEYSTSEIIQEGKKMNWDLQLEHGAAKLLQTADLVKFAKAIPEAPIHEQCMQEAVRFVEATRPVIEISDDEEKEVSA